MVSHSILLYWYISSSSLVFGLILDLIFISVGCFIRDDRDFSDICLNLGLVLCLPNCIVPGLTLSFILYLMLNPVLFFEHSVVSNLFLLIDQDLILIRVSDLLLISVEGLGVFSVQDLDISPVSVLFLLSVLDFIPGFPHNNRYVSEVGLSVGFVDCPWNVLVLCQVLFLVLDLIFGGVPIFHIFLVLDFCLSVDVCLWYMPCPPLDLFLLLNAVFNFIVVNWEVSELGLLSVLNMSMSILIVVVVVVVTVV